MEEKQKNIIIAAKDDEKNENYALKEEEKVDLKPDKRKKENLPSNRKADMKENVSSENKNANNIKITDKYVPSQQTTSSKSYFFNLFSGKNLPSLKPEFLQKWDIPLFVFINMLLCYYLGSYHFGSVWFFLVVLSVIFVYRKRIQAFKTLLITKIERELAQKSKLNHYETAEWINLLLRRVWGVYEPVLSAQVQDQVNLILADACPSFLGSLKLATFTLGSEAPQLVGAIGYSDTDSDIVHMEVDVLFVPKKTVSDSFVAALHHQSHLEYASKIVLAARVGKGVVGVDVPISVEGLRVYAKSKIILNLMAALPVIKIAQVSLIENPKIDFTLKPLKTVDIMDTPMLSRFLQSTIQGIVGSIAVEPNRITLNLDDIINRARLKSDKSIGVVRLVVYSAHLSKESEPYVTIEKEGKRIGKSHSIHKTSDPSWNVCYYILMQDLRSIIECSVLSAGETVIGGMLGKKERFLGKANLIIADGTVYDELNDTGLPTHTPALIEPPVSTTALKSLDGQSAMGELTYSLGYYPVVNLVNDDGSEKLPRSSILDKFASGILRFTVHSAKDMVFRGSIARPMNTYIEILVAGANEDYILNMDKSHATTLSQWNLLWKSLADLSLPTFTTKTKKSTNCPIWDSTYDILVKNLKACVLLVRLIESGGHSGGIGDVLALGMVEEGNHPLSYLIVRLSDALKTSEIDSWYNLGSSGNPLEQGKLHLACVVAPLSTDFTGSDDIIVPPYRPPLAILHLQLLESLNISTLFHESSGLFSDLKSTAKAFVRVSLSGRQLFRSGADPVTAFNPVYCMDTSCHEIALIRSLKGEETISFEIYLDTFGSDLVAVCELPVEHVLRGDYLDSWISCKIVGKYTSRKNTQSKNKNVSSTQGDEDLSQVQSVNKNQVEQNEDLEKPLTIDLHVQMCVKEVENLDDLEPDSENINGTLKANSEDIRQLKPKESSGIKSSIFEQLNPGLNILSVSIKEFKKLPEKKFFSARVLSSSICNTASIPYAALHTVVSSSNSTEVEEIVDVPVILPDKNDKDSLDTPFAVIQLAECPSSGRRVDWQKISKTTFESPITLSDIMKSKQGVVSLLLAHSENNHANSSLPEMNITVQLKHIHEDACILPFLLPVYPHCLLTLTLVKATQLMPVDSNGKADPYVTVHLNGLKIAKSKTIKKNLNPQWDTSTTAPHDKDGDSNEFFLPLVHPGSSIVTLQVKDWNRVDIDIPIGVTNIYVYREISKLALSHQGSTSKAPLASEEVTFELLNCTSGNITFKLAFQDILLEGFEDHELDSAQNLLAKKYTSSLAQYNSELKEYQSSRNMLLAPIDFVGSSLFGGGKLLGKTMIGTGKLLGTGTLGTGKLLGAGALGTGKLLGTGAMESGKLLGAGALGTGKLFGSGVVKSGQMFENTAVGTAHVLGSTAGFASKPFKKLFSSKDVPEPIEPNSSIHSKINAENEDPDAFDESHQVSIKDSYKKIDVSSDLDENEHNDAEKLVKHKRSIVPKFLKRFSGTPGSDNHPAPHKDS